MSAIYWGSADFAFFLTRSVQGHMAQKERNYSKKGVSKTQGRGGVWGRGHLFFLEKDVLGLRLELGLTLTATLKQHGLKKKIDPTSAPTPALRFTNTLLKKVYLDD